jgi:hypothetical protein
MVRRLIRVQRLFPAFCGRGGFVDSAYGRAAALRVGRFAGVGSFRTDRVRHDAA